MATYYIDFANGNDANDGLSFANRKKTLPTFTRGDFCRIMKSPDPQSIGAAQWTDNSATITPTTMPTLLIDECESGWLGTTNSTVTHGTTASIRKTGAAYLNDSIAAGFTTGKLAYKQLGATLDLSAYQQLSFWFMSTGATVALRIDLCSDTTGDTPLAQLSVTLTGDITTSQWRPVVLDFGAALPSGINSISVHATTDPGTVTWRLDNIVAAKAPGGANCITHTTLIGKNTGGEPEWYPISEFTATGIVVGGNALQLVATNPVRPYRGTTESVTTYIRHCHRVPALGGMDVNFGIAAEYTLPFNMSGGWNSTDMSTQDGETWFNGDHTRNGIRGSCPHTNISKVGFANTVTPFTQLQGENANLDILGFVGCVNDFGFSTSGLSVMKIKIGNVWGAHAGLLEGLTATSPCSIRMEVNRVHGFCNTTTSVAAVHPNRFIPDQYDLHIKKIDNNFTGIRVPQGTLKIRGATIENNSVNVRWGSTQAAGMELWLDGCTEIDFTSAAIHAVIRQTCANGNENNNSITCYNSYLKMQNTVALEGSYAWEIAIKSQDYYPENPFRFPIAKVACNANKLVTVKCWLRKTHATAYDVGLMVERDDVRGIAETFSYMSDTLDTWEEVTLTFTPTKAGVVTIFGAAANTTAATSQKGYFDLMTVDQAA